MGHFNLCDPREESCSVHFEYTNGDEKKYLNLSFSEEQGTTGYVDAEDAAYLIDAWDKRMFISTRRMKPSNPKRKKTVKFLGYNEVEFACYFDHELVEMERWTDRGWMYWEVSNPRVLYFQPKYAHTKKVLMQLV